MKNIELTQGKIAMVSNVDFNNLSRYKWHALRLRSGYFVACRMVRVDGKRVRIYMHREVMAYNGSLLVDHRNHDTLDNRRSNLRLATHADNRHNSKPDRDKKTSKFNGVSFDKKSGRYVVQISIDGKQTKVGRFKNEIDAARRYNTFAKLHYGKFAYLNKL